MPQVLLPPKMRLFIDPKAPIRLDEYIAKLVGKTKLNEKAIKTALAAVKNQTDMPDIEGMDGKAKKVLANTFLEIKADWKAHNKGKVIFEKAVEDEKEAKKKEREEAKEKAEAVKKEYSEAFEEANQDKTLTVATGKIQETVDETLQNFLGPKLIVKDNKIVVKAGKTITKEDLANAFAGFSRWNEVNGAIVDSAAKREAQLAFIAKENFGDDWKNFFQSHPKDIARIQKYMRVFELAGKIDGEDLLMAIPLSTFRVIAENKFVKGDEDKNNKHKKTVVGLVESNIETNKGVVPSQTEVRNIVAGYKKKIGIESKVQMRFAYLFIDNDSNIFAVGSEEMDDAMCQAAVLTFDRSFNVISVDADGTVVKGEAIEEPTDDQQEIIDALIKENEPDEPEEKEKSVKKTDKESKKKEPKEEEPDPDDDPDSGDEPIDDEND